MKRLFLCIIAVAFMLMPASKINAQYSSDTLLVQHGDFEQWDTLPGDTVVALMFPIPVFDAYTLPQGWSVPMLSIDETLNYSGFNLHVATTIPIGQVWRDTVNQPEGSSGVVAQSFLLSDILTPVAYSLASEFLDTAFTSQVIPTVLSNANLDLMRFIPLMDVIFENTSDLSWLYDILDTVDINDYISGGMPLNGFEPGYLRGYYKFRDGGNADHAAAVLLGTHYDTISHRRLIVGAGSKTLWQLPDSVNYDTFQFEYFTLAGYFPAEYSYMKADTAIVLFISSASDKVRARGSRLYLDSIQLIHADGSCGRIIDFGADSLTLSFARLVWSNTASPDHYQLEYGRAGFTQGMGFRVTIPDSTFTLLGLDPATTYEAYVRGLCGDSTSTSWVYTSFTTDSIPVGIQSSASAPMLTVAPNPSNGSILLTVEQAEPVRLTVYTIDGRELIDHFVSGSTIPVHLPHAGMYIVRLQTTQGSLYQKILVE